VSRIAHEPRTRCLPTDSAGVFIGTAGDSCQQGRPDLTMQP